LPATLQDAFGYTLYRIQRGAVPANAKPFHGFGGAGVLEIANDFNGNAYRAICTVRLATTVYVLHVFQKKSKRGISMPWRDREMLRERLLQAEVIDSHRRKDH
jgi:phage-related protein